MLISTKINLKKYVYFSIPLILFIIYVSRSIHEVIAMLIVFVAAILNQWMLVTLVRESVANAAFGNKIKKLSFILMSLGKIILLIGAITFSVQIMGNRIIISVLIYVLQIAVLYFSFDKNQNL